MPTLPGHGTVTQKVIVMRHGERRDSRPDTPAEVNPPLTEEGKKDVATVAARLKKIFGEATVAQLLLVVSPFMRTLETAEALQQHGVGCGKAVIVDNTLCEVFGPSRIKTDRAPVLITKGHGGLPLWGESLENATDRYVDNFMRIGDKFGGMCRRVESSDGNCSGPGRETPQNLLLVTHGDALNAVLNHFYPARTVYDAEFLSYICMHRFGMGNSVYHLECSWGVSWILDGIDREPADSILSALADAVASSPTSDYACRHSDSDEDADAPNGNLNRRAVTKRLKVNPHRAPNAVQAAKHLQQLSRPGPSTPFQGSPPECSGGRPQSPVPRPRVKETRKRPENQSSTLSDSPTGGASHSKGNSHHSLISGSGGDRYPTSQQQLSHPNGYEGCDRIRPPSGIPAQSSTVFNKYTYGQASLPSPEAGSVSQRYATVSIGPPVVPVVSSQGLSWASHGVLLSFALRVLTALSQVPSLFLWSITAGATIYVTTVVLVEATQAAMLAWFLHHSYTDNIDQLVEHMGRTSPQPQQLPNTTEPLEYIADTETGNEDSVFNDNNHTAAMGLTSASLYAPLSARTTPYRLRQLFLMNFGSHVLATASKALVVTLLSFSLCCVVLRPSSFLDVLGHLTCNTGALLIYILYWLLDIVRGVVDARCLPPSE